VRLGSLSAFVLISAQLTRVVLEFIPLQEPGHAALIGSLVFGSAVLSLPCTKAIRLELFATSASFLGLLLAAAGISATLALCLETSFEQLSPITFLGVFIPALVEETIFRGVLALSFFKEINGITLSIRFSRVFAALVSSVLFSLGHFHLELALPGAWATGEAIRLAIIGLLYTALAFEMGFVIVTSLHTALNLALLGASPSFTEYNSALIVPAIAIATASIVLCDSAEWPYRSNTALILETRDSR